MYFRLEINSNVNSDVMQLSEFSLSIQDVDDMDYAFLPTDGTQRADGQDQYLNLFNNNSQNYWYCPGSYKQNGVWFVEFHSSSCAASNSSTTTKESGAQDYSPFCSEFLNRRGIFIRIPAFGNQSHGHRLSHGIISVVGVRACW